jgi:hypothetical protein
LADPDGEASKGFSWGAVLKACVNPLIIIRKNRISVRKLKKKAIASSSLDLPHCSDFLCLLSSISSDISVVQWTSVFFAIDLRFRSTPVTSEKFKAVFADDDQLVAEEEYENVWLNFKVRYHISTVQMTSGC